MLVIRDAQMRVFSAGMLDRWIAGHGDGVVVFLFENATTQPAEYQDTNGQTIRPTFPGTLPNTEARRSRTGYMQFARAAAYEPPQSITQTVFRSQLPLGGSSRAAQGLR